MADLDCQAAFARQQYYTTKQGKWVQWGSGLGGLFSRNTLKHVNVYVAIIRQKAV